MHIWSITRRTISVQDLGTATAYIPEKLIVEAMYYIDKDGFHIFFDEHSAAVFSIASDSVEMLSRDDAVMTSGKDSEQKFFSDLVGTSLD